MTRLPTRPGPYDLLVTTGDAWGKAVQLWAPGPAVLVSDLVVGERIFYEGAPERIHAITTQDSETYVIMMRGGFLGDPWFKAFGYSSVRSAVLEQVAAAEAAWMLIADAALQWQGTKMIIPTTVSTDDGGTIEMIMSDAETSALEEHHGVWRWDLHAQIGGAWMAVLTGTMIINRGVARSSDWALPVEASHV